MAKYCPAVGRRVVYLECLECEEKICEELMRKANNDADKTAGKQTETQKRIAPN